MHEYTDDELLRKVYADPKATETERELARRLDAKIDELEGTEE